MRSTWGSLEAQSLERGRQWPALVGIVVGIFLGCSIAACKGPLESGGSESGLGEGTAPPPRTAVASSCARLTPPPFVVGANVIDRPDDRDPDPTNDGARGYGSDAARRQLDRLVALGLTGVVLPVEIYATDVTATAIRRGQLASDHGLPRLGQMIDDAHQRGLVVTVVPHLLLDDDGWRGDMKHQGAARERLLAGYLAAVLPIARTAEAHCAEVFSFGVEMRALTTDKTSGPLFNRLIEAFRGVFAGGLTYSANWDEVGAVRFWDQLDGVGVNAFFPLASKPGVAQSVLERRATAAQKKLLVVQQRVRKPLWLMEIGFKATPGSYVEPWKWPAEVMGSSPPLDEAAQKRGYRAVIQALRSVPAASAAFFWAVPADPDDGGHPYAFEPRWGFNFLGKGAEAEVRALASSPPVR